MEQKKYSQPVIRGSRYARMLPKGVGLVLEGGGTRGFYSSGVFEAFMDRGIMFPYIAGVSAGAANAFSYVAGQRGRNRQIAAHYVSDARYVSYRNMFRHGSMFGYKFIFETIPERHVFFDQEMFDAADIDFYIGAVDCELGKTVWFEKKELERGYPELVASCSVPLVAPVVRAKGRDLLDGGITAPIPIEKSMSDGNEYHVVVLTRNKGFRRKPFSHGNLARLVYRKYPRLIEALRAWHDEYNRQLELCEELEAKGKAHIIRPQVPLQVSRLTRDTEKLLKLYDEGHEEGAQAADLFMAAIERLWPEGL